MSKEKDESLKRGLEDLKAGRVHPSKEVFAKPSPLPWKEVKDAQGTMGLLHPRKKGVAVCWFSSTFHPANGFVGEKESERGRPERQANVELIVKSVNLFPRLVEALEKYGRHTMQCTSDQLAGDDRCTCYLAELLQEAKGTERGDE